MFLRISQPTKEKCMVCGREAITISRSLNTCGNCIRDRPAQSIPLIEVAHRHAREAYKLPAQPPNSSSGVLCNICANECRMAHGERSYCGLRWEENGHLKSYVSSRMALVHTYYDPLPTNCCAAWFCPGSVAHGSANFAVFFYGCGFNCLFCQNESHKGVDVAPSMTLGRFVEKALNPRVSCICYFGGDICPQLPFALKASKQVLEQCAPHRIMRICWETNGIGNPKLIREAAELSLRSNGNVKFDLKAINTTLARALSGVSNQRAYENFAMIAEEFYEQRPKNPVLTAVTLLTPGYTDEKEVEGIAQFIADLNPEIPYSLLIFHPAHYMTDLPITPPDQIERCYQVARKYLKYVNIGNKHFLPTRLRNIDNSSLWRVRG